MIRYVKLSDVEKMIDDAERIFQETEDCTEVGYMASDINLELLPAYDIDDDCRGRRVAHIIHQHHAEEPEEVYCDNCKSPLQGYENYCPYCGIKLVDE